MMSALTSFSSLWLLWLKTRANVIAVEQRLYGEVRKGYTYLAEGDVLFAKIIPCMQNGKTCCFKGTA